MNLLRPKLITFDVTGTLLTTKLVEYYEAIAVQYGVSVDRNKLAPSFKTNYKRLILQHPIYGKHTGLGWENWWRNIVFNVFRDQDDTISKPILDKIATRLIKAYGTKECWHACSGTVELLEYLTKRDLTIGVISNFDERLESILKDTCIRRYFSFVIASYIVGIEKPNPSIFQEALRLASEISGAKILPQEAIHIGDSVAYDYIGAKNAGWNAILIKQGDESSPIDDEEIPHTNVVTNLGDLKIHLSRLLDAEPDT